MILTDEQLNRTKATLRDFENTFEHLKNEPSPLALIEKKALLSTINELKYKISEYEGAKIQAASFNSVVNLSELRKQLVLGRIAKGYSQKTFADTLNISPALLNRFEATEYDSVGLSMLLKCAYSLGRNIDKIFEEIDGRHLEVYNKKFGDVIPFWDQLPIKEIIRSKWISASNSLEEIKELILSSGANTNSAFHRKTTLQERTAKSASLFAWEAKVLFEAKKIVHKSNLIYVEHNANWLNDLVSLSKFANGPLLAQNFLLEKGIILVIEPHLEKTYLDGAAMLTDEGFPVIGLTLRLNRIDNFWFVLLHEIGHVYLHLLTNKFPIFLDEYVGDKTEDYFEIEANNFARNSLISEENWRKCLSPVFTTESTVCNDAKNLGIHPAIIAGRLQFEKNDYKILSNMTGHGEIKHIFGFE